jgi:hypothetical protein
MVLKVKYIYVIFNFLLFYCVKYTLTLSVNKIYEEGYARCFFVPQKPCACPAGTFHRTGEKLDFSYGKRFKTMWLKTANDDKLGAEGLSSTVITRDVTGQEFKTSHNIVIETVLATVLKELNSKIAEVEQQINFSA